ncbi:MAG: DMT family transporter [Methylophilaceae bacterium]
MKQEKLWVLAMVAVTVLWGWSFVAIHESVTTLSASAFNTWRFLVGAAVMLALLARRIQHIKFADLKHGAIAGVVLFLAYTLQTSGLVLTTASNSSFITGLAVVFTPLFAKVFLNAPPTKQQVFGTMLATIGLGLLTIRDFSVQSGDVLALGCAIFFALHIIILSKISKNGDVEVLAFVQVLVVALLSLAWSTAAGEMSLPPTNQAVSTILILGIGGTAIACFVQTKAQVLTAPTKIALILVLEPVFGGIFGYFLAGDRLTMLNMLGAALIVLAMLASEVKLVQSK